LRPLVDYEVLVPRCTLACFVPAAPASAQAPQADGPQAKPPTDDTIARPAGPLLVRGPDGKVIVRATRIIEPMRIDGKLDEAVYGEIPPIADFIQQEPNEGAPATEKTEAWILFDDKNIYVMCRCWDSNPGAIVANDMRRDSPNINSHDSFGVQLDPYHDGRGAFFFYMTPVGGVRDAAIVDSRPNNDWNTVWESSASRFDQGWIAEIAIPFKSLRYGPGREQTWGIQVRRLIRSKNERIHLTRLPASWGSGAWNRMHLAATLTDLQAPKGSRNLEIKPYAISTLSTNRLAVPPTRNEFSPDIGLDVKYGVTKGLTADFSYNTDFAQVEADEAQVNLTRFSLSFPEKREFFLEGSLALHLRRGPEHDGRRCPGDLLQPERRAEPRAGAAGDRRREAYRTRRCLEHRSAQHRGGRRQGAGHQADELHGAAPSPQHLQSRVARRYFHEAVRLDGRPRVQRGLWARRERRRAQVRQLRRVCREVSDRGT
jgi:hypothetical protein